MDDREGLQERVSEIHDNDDDLLLTIKLNISHLFIHS